MYRAKSRGKGRYAIFEPGMHTAIVERLDLEVDLKRAIEHDELVLVYQPIFSLRSGAVAGVEALVRWRHPTRGVVLPEHFVPLAEESGVIRELGRWVLRTACHQGALWRARYPGHPGLQIGVNVSGAQLREPGLVEEVTEALAAAQLDAPGLTLEITETALMESFETAIEQLDALKLLGVDLAIDDFGIGYSSLRYLRRLPLDNLKIEKSFVDGIGEPDDEPALLRAIVDLAEHLRPHGDRGGNRAARAAGATARAGLRSGPGSPALRAALAQPTPTRSCSASVFWADPLPPAQGRPGARRHHRLRSSRRPIVARIENYSPGRVVVDGVELNRDVIVLPNRVLRNWWRRDGHSLVIQDLEDVLEELPRATDRRLRILEPAGARSLGDRGAPEAGGEGRGAADGGRSRPLRGAGDPKPGGRRGGASPDLLIAALAALAVALVAPAPAAANENFANEPPFGGELPPPLVRPPSQRRPPAGFELSGREAIRIADGADAVRDERAESPEMRPIAFERGADWQVSYFTGSGAAAPRSPRRSSTTGPAQVLGAWHDHQLGRRSPAATRARSPRRSTRPYVWLPLCLLFLAPFFDPRRPFRLLHLDLLVLLGLGVSLFFFNRGEITASVAAHLSGARLRVRADAVGRASARGERAGPLVPVLAGAVAGDRRRRPGLRADRPQRRRLARDRHRRRRRGRRRPHRPRAGRSTTATSRPGSESAATSTGRSTTSPTCPFEAVFPWDGHWGDVPAAHAAAIAFDLLTALGLLGARPAAARRPRGPGARDRRSRSPGSPTRSRSTR